MILVQLHSLLVRFDCVLELFMIVIKVTNTAQQVGVMFVPGVGVHVGEEGVVVTPNALVAITQEPGLVPYIGLYDTSRYSPR